MLNSDPTIKHCNNELGSVGKGKTLPIYTILVAVSAMDRETDIVRTATDQILLLRTPQDRALGHIKSGWPEIRYENLLFSFQLYTPVPVPGYKVVLCGSLQQRNEGLVAH